MSRFLVSFSSADVQPSSISPPSTTPSPSSPTYITYVMYTGIKKEQSKAKIKLESQ